MADPNPNHIAGMPPAKLGLIAVLAVVFVAVVVYQIASSTSTPVVLKKRAAKDGSTASGSEAGDPSSDAAADAAQRKTKWVAIPCSEVRLHDPFALPQALNPEISPPQQIEAVENPEEPQLSRREQTLQSFLHNGVGLFLATPRGSVAMIGNVRLRLGDVVDGLRVVEIGPRGIAFEEVADKEGTD